MKTAFIYTRYSSDKQNKTSNEDQETKCRTYALTHGFEIARVFADSETSGKTLNRVGFSAMVDAVKKEKPELILVDDLSRLSRNSTDQGLFLRSLEFLGIGLVAVSEGIDTREYSHKIHSAFKGILNELYLDNLRMHTRRGQEGAVSRGNVAGGKSYGYDHVKSATGGVQRVINEEEALVVQRIFQLFADGESPLKIAQVLNEEGIPSPTGKLWKRSAIHGDPNDLSGILNNPLYDGRVIWNRLSYKTNPDTGKRVSRRNPSSEWSEVAMPELRIVPKELWDKVKARQRQISDRSKKKMAEAGPKARTGAGSKYLLSGLLRCQDCGGNFVLLNSKSYGCATRKESGPHTCKNAVLIKKQVVEGFVLNAVSKAASPARLESAILERFKALANHRLNTKPVAKSPAERLAVVQKEIDNIISSIKKGCPAEEFVDEMQRLREQKEALQLEIQQRQPSISPEQELQRAVDKAVALLPTLTSSFCSVLHRNTPLARKALDKLFDGGINVFKMPEGKIGLKSNAYVGNFFDSALLLPEFSNSREINVVAGAGFEPTTFGL